MDRRVRRSRQALRDALVALVVESGYAAVTVDALVERADLSRATFYAHYRDVGALLGELVTELAESLLERLHPMAELGRVRSGELVRDICRHAGQHQALYRVILSGAADGAARDAYAGVLSTGIERILRRTVEVSDVAPRVDPAVVACTWTGAFLALCHWWFEEQPDRSAEDIADMAEPLTLRGFLWSIGVDEPLTTDAGPPADS